MKILLDSCMGIGVFRALQNAGHDVVSIGINEKDPGDEAVLNRAFQEKRVLVTLDKDFGELAIIFGKPHSGILRLVGLSMTNQIKICIQVLETHGPMLIHGALITAEISRLRIRSQSDKS